MLIRGHFFRLSVSPFMYMGFSGSPMPPPHLVYNAPIRAPQGHSGGIVSVGSHHLPQRLTVLPESHLALTWWHRQCPLRGNLVSA